MAKKEKRSFGGKVTGNADRQRKRGAEYGHLMLPKGVSVFKPEPDSKSRLDFMPYEVTDPKHLDRDDEQGIAVVGDLWYKKPYYLHRNIGSVGDNLVCPKTFGKPCPICEHRAERAKDGADKDELKALKPSLRNLYVVIPLGEKKIEEEPHIFDMSQYLFQDKLNEELSEDEDVGVFPDLEEGMTVRVRWAEGKIEKTTFAECSRIDFDERDEPYDEEILEDIPNLDEVLIVLSYKEIAAKFYEYPEPEDGDDEDEDDDHPAKNRKKKTGKKVPAKKAPAKEDEDEQDEEDDEPEETPAKKSKGKKGKKKARPEPEEEQEDEDEPDEDACVACEGSGKNTKGNTCRICKGSGKKKKAEPEEEDEQDEEDEPSPKKGKKNKSKKSKKGGCPHGHVFGVDFEEFDECFDDCEQDDYDACEKAKEDE